LVGKQLLVLIAVSFGHCFDGLEICVVGVAPADADNIYGSTGPLDEVGPSPL